MHIINFVGSFFVLYLARKFMAPYYCGNGYFNYHITKPIIKSLTSIISSLLYLEVIVILIYRNTRKYRNDLQNHKSLVSKISTFTFILVYITATILLLGVTMCTRACERLAMAKSWAAHLIHYMISCIVRYIEKNPAGTHYRYNRCQIC